ncbi:tetratricopeptide repeat protein [Sphingomonas sp.]|uniref:tetratricopeptide repeat protein n=1 Tax=Sphingomonas sp. TaxID=28214 RepID=UPI0035BC1EC7
MLDTLSREEVDAQLAGSPEARAALIREGAEGGVAEAQAVYGQMLLDRGEASTALIWFVKAAAQHNVIALNMVGRCYDLGWGTAPDKRRAAECYRVAATRGLDWAMYNYATLLALGDGVAQDRAAALAWLEKAADMDNAKAMNFVGSFAEDGWACERDLARAAAFYARAAAGGDFRGCFNHARMLTNEGRIDEALTWLRRAGATATPAFVDKAAAWCESSPLGVTGAAAVREGARC